MGNKKNKKRATSIEEHNNGSSLEKCVEPWKSYRDEIIVQKLELEKQIDKTVFAIASGALGISLAFLDKFTPPESSKYLFFILGLGWLSLVLTLIFQTFSFVITAKQIKFSISKAEDVIRSENIDLFQKNEEQFYDSWTEKNKRIDQLDKRSFWSMIIGILFILLFAFLSLTAKRVDKPQKIEIVNSDSLINK